MMRGASEKRPMRAIWPAGAFFRISVSPKSDHCIPVIWNSICLNCDHPLSPAEEVCPRCGMPRSLARLIRRVKIYGVILVFVAGSGFALVYHFTGSTGSAKLDAAIKKEEERPAGSKRIRFSSVAEAQQEAVRRHPDLGVSGSMLNAAYVARYKYYQRERPSYFSDNSWPVRLADEVVASEIHN